MAFGMKDLWDYKVANLDDSGEPIYVGKTDEDGNWFIMRFNSTTGVADYAFGNSGYSDNWTNRASLSYTALSSQV